MTLTLGTAAGIGWLIYSFFLLRSRRYITWGFAEELTNEHWITRHVAETDEPINLVCPLGQILAALYILFLLARLVSVVLEPTGAERWKTWSLVLVVLGVSLASLMNLNALLLLLPSVVVELCLILGVLATPPRDLGATA